MANQDNVVMCRSYLFGFDHMYKARRDFRKFTDDLCARHGDAVSLNIFGHRVFLFARPEYAHQILVEDRRFFEKPGNQRKVFGRTQIRASFNMDGEPWVERRKAMSPYYSPQAVEGYREIVMQQVEHVFSGLTDGRTEIGRPMSAISLGSAAESLFGSDVRDVAFAYRDHMLKQQAVLSRRVFSRIHLPRWLTPKRDRLVASATEFFHGVVDRLISARRNSTDRPDDLLTKLLFFTSNEDGRLLSDEDVRSEILNNFVATSDTMASAMTWATYLLAANPEWQDRILEESDANNVGGDNEQSTNESTATRVFKEAMRLYPPAVTMTRRAIDEAVVGPARIPKDALVYVLVHRIQRDPRWFDEPDEFRPDRFLQDSEKRITLGAFLPFGLGPQTCIGRTFAMMEGPLVLSELVRRFHFRLPVDRQFIEMETQLSLHPKGGLILELERRTGSASNPELSRTHCSYGRVHS